MLRQQQISIYAPAHVKTGANLSHLFIGTLIPILIKL